MLAWKLVHSWLGRWFRAGLGISSKLVLGVGSKLVWELVQSWFGSWFKAGFGN
jgi:hypothetical protein